VLEGGGSGGGAIVGLPGGRLGPDIVADSKEVELGSRKSSSKDVDYMKARDATDQQHHSCLLIVVLADE